MDFQFCHRKKKSVKMLLKSQKAQLLSFRLDSHCRFSVGFSFKCCSDMFGFKEG